MSSHTPPPRNISVNGTELAYVEAGKGPLLVLVHGTLGDYRTWRSQVQEFSSHYHVVAYSRRFHFPGNWTRTAGEYTLEQHAEDLAALIKRFGETPANLVCASWGGNVALQLAMNEPILVRSMVLAEPPTLPLLANDPRHKHLLDQFELTSLLPARDALRKDDWDEGIRLFINGVMGSGVYEKLPAGVRRYFAENATELKGELLSTHYLPDFTPAMLSTIQTPVLLLQGDRSPKFFHAITEILNANLPSAQLFTVPKASHGIHADNPSVHNKLVLDFLQAR